MIQLFLALMSLEAGPVTVPPETISLRSTTVELALEQFQKLCLEPRFDPHLTAAAVAASSLKLVPIPEFDRDKFHQRRWQAPEAIVTLTYIDGSTAGFGLPQCEVNMASAKPHTKEMLRARVKALLSPYATSEPTFPPDQEGAIEWIDPHSDNTYRIDVAIFDRDGAPTNSTDLLITAYSTEGMRAFNRMRVEKNPRTGAQ